MHALVILMSLLLPLLVSCVPNTQELPPSTEPPTGQGGTIEEGAQEGGFCGGIAAFPCAKGLRCRYDGTYPDAGGTCVREE